LARRSRVLMSYPRKRSRHDLESHDVSDVASYLSVQLDSHDPHDLVDAAFILCRDVCKTLNAATVSKPWAADPDITVEVMEEIGLENDDVWCSSLDAAATRKLRSAHPYRAGEISEGLSSKTDVVNPRAFVTRALRSCPNKWRHPNAANTFDSLKKDEDESVNNETMKAVADAEAEIADLMVTIESRRAGFSKVAAEIDALEDEIAKEIEWPKRA